jgi:hypothetical protein
MDPITDLVRDRTADLQRTADQVRQERDLRATATARPTTTASHPSAVRGSPQKVCNPSPAEPAT